MVGLTADEIIGRPFTDFFGNDDGLDIFKLHVDDLKTDTSFTIETTLKRNGGTFLPVVVNSDILNDKQQEKSFLFSFFTDIKKQKTREEQLRLFSQAVDQSGSSIVITDKNGDIQYVNPRVCSTTGYNAKELVGENPRILKSGVQPEAIYKQLWQTITQGETWRDRLHNRRKDGTLFWEDVTISPFFDVSGAITHFMAIKNDVTDQVALEQKLRDAEKEAVAINLRKTEFLANMSHEIRTPMNVIIGMSNLALETPLNGSQRKFITSIRKSANALLRLVNDILDYSKVETGHLVLETRTFDLEKLLTDIETSLSGSSREKGLKLITRIQGQGPYFIQGDSLRLRQILLNLTANAIKFTDKGRVEVNARLEAENNEQVRVLFSVRDTGVGIKKEQQSVLFDSFSQGDASVARKYGGTGLGLGICRQLVQLMNGSIHLKSALGKGTTFFFNVVFARGAKKAAESDQVSSSLHPPSRPIDFLPLDILFVEDNQGNQDLARIIIEKGGHRVTMADSGLKALHALAKCSFDLVFMDIQMPQMDGLTATGYIRKYEEGQGVDLPLLKSIEKQLRAALKDQHIPIIAVTASAMPGDRQRCLAAGADDYLSKPYNNRALLEMAANYRGSQGPARDITFQYQEVAVKTSDELKVQIRQHLLDSFGIDAQDSEDIIKIYSSTLATAIARLKTAIEKRDLPEISRQGHTIKGALFNLGQNELADKVQCMEKAAKMKKDYNYLIVAEEMENKMKPLFPYDP